MTLLIANSHIVTGDAADTRLPRGDVLIEGNRIAMIGPDLGHDAGARPPDLEIIDASGSIVLPGLINAHVHSNEGFDRGAYDNLPLELWLLESYPPWGMPRFSERQHYLRTMLTAIEAIRSGTTTLQDDLLHFEGTPEGADGAAKAFSEAVLRAFITITMWNRPLVESLPFARELIPVALQNELAAAPPPSVADILRLFCRHRHRTARRLPGFGVPSSETVKPGARGDCRSRPRECSALRTRPALRARDRQDQAFGAQGGFLALAGR